MSSFLPYKHPYEINPAYQKKVAYFCMEFGVDQALKIFSGGLGYLAGSHMRSAHDLGQQLIGIGILWKYGYYDQVRQGNQEMDVLFQERGYNFLEDTGIQFPLTVNRHPVQVKVWYLPPHVFGTAPMFLLSTDVEGNDYLARTISHRLYASNVETKIAQYILLGKGGANLMDLLGFEPDVYHLNEAHGLPAAFHLYNKLGSLKKVQEKVVFTTHTPVEAGNEKHDIHLLKKMSFFDGLALPEVRAITGIKDDLFNQSLAALRFSHKANGVSKLHGEVSREMWAGHANICSIGHITNAQNHKYWKDDILFEALQQNDDEVLISRKKTLKKRLFAAVADQTGKLFDPDVLTIVWARRFAGYKRADLITRDEEVFEKLITNDDRPIQIIWAGKPYPTDYGAVSIFNNLVHLSKKYDRAAVLTGYELSLSRLLKYGADIWLNTPRITREASGTSGMTAAMNGAVNLSTFDGWIPEFAKDGENCFVIPPVKLPMTEHDQDEADLQHLLRILEGDVKKLYYQEPHQWLQIVKQSMTDILPFFGSDRMAQAYYEKMYA